VIPSHGGNVSIDDRLGMRFNCPFGFLRLGTGTSYRVCGIWMRDALQSFVRYELRSSGVVVVHVRYALKSVCRLLHGFSQLEAI
jgi:hypothetical protein